MHNAPISHAALTRSGAGVARVLVALCSCACMALASAGPGRERPAVPPQAMPAPRDADAARMDVARMEAARQEALQRQEQMRAYEEQRRAAFQQQARPVIQPQNDGFHRNGRLTPDERRDLRRQINEAGHDIYATTPRR